MPRKTSLKAEQHHTELVFNDPDFLAEYEIAKNSGTVEQLDAVREKYRIPNNKAYEIDFSFFKRKDGSNVPNVSTSTMSLKHQHESGTFRIILRDDLSDDELQKVMKAYKRQRDKLGLKKQNAWSSNYLLFYAVFKERLNNVAWKDIFAKYEQGDALYRSSEFRHTDYLTKEDLRKAYTKYY